MDIRQALITTISSIQSVSGRTSANIHGNTRPMRDLEGFDSLNAFEVSCELGIALGCEIKPDIALFFKDGEARTIDEIVEDLSAIIIKQESD